MAYTYDVTTDRGRVRLRLGDATQATGATTGYVFEDAEVDEFLSAGTTVNGAVIEGAKVLLANAALRTKYFSLKGLSLDDRHQVETIAKLLAVYGGDLPTVAIDMPALLPMDEGFDEADP